MARLLFEVFVVELVAGPEQAAGDEVEVAGVFDGVVVVAERGGEDFGAAVVVGPDDDVVVVGFFAFLVLGRLLAAGEGVAVSCSLPAALL